jgi:small subunit ribosomal protein S2
LSTEIIKQLLEAGVHFGHKTSRWNPKMKKFIFGQRSGIYIIDLEKTCECIKKTIEYLVEITSKGETVMFVGTKKQAQEVVYQEAVRCGMYYVTERWPGGMLTNFVTVKKSIKRLKDIERMREDGTFGKFTKKEVSLLEKECLKLKKNFSGIVNMEKMPSAIFIVDTNKEDTSVKEARKLSIPIIGLIDTNSDPTHIAFPIPGNDDATKSIKVITTMLADAVIEGRKNFLSYLSDREAVIASAAAKKDLAEPVVMPEEEIKIKEIEELLEDTGEESSTDAKGAKKARVKPVDDKSKRKV